MGDIISPSCEPFLPAEMPHTNELVQCETCINWFDCLDRSDHNVFVKCESPDYQTVITSALVVQSDPLVIRQLEQVSDKLRVLQGFRNAVIGEQFIKPEFLGDEYYELGWGIGHKAITQ